MVFPLVIDTDTAADDCFALLVGLLHPAADLRAVTIVAGNVGFDQQVHNALLTIALSGRAGQIPVHLGSRRPLVRDWVSASEVHGDGVGGIRRPDDGQQVRDEHAVDALIRLSHEHAGSLRVVGIGPLTNIALAVLRDPGFAARVERLTIMAGSVNGRGNITAAAEYNVFVDPEAADIVLRAGFEDVQFVSWDPVTITDTVFNAELVAEIGAQQTTLSKFFVRANAATFDFDLSVGINGSTHPDSLSVALALDEDLVLEERRYQVSVELHGTHTTGATVCDWRPGAVPNVRAPLRVDAARFHRFMADLFATTPTISAELAAAVEN